MTAHQQEESALVSIVMGSASDLSVMEKAVQVLKQAKVPHEIRIISAHRTPWEMLDFAGNARERGIRVLIAGAGGAAHLPGMLAAGTTLPVIGVPVPLADMEGIDSLLSIIQMPKGVPVLTVGIGKAEQAARLAIAILAMESGLSSGPR
jgi:5-(carboxyamino)imidazole ribonucleotide mutase